MTNPFALLCSNREIWSCICIHTFPNICCTILHPLWPCWYVFLLVCLFLILYWFMQHKHIINEFLAVSASVGLSFLQFTNMNSMRNLMITGLSLFLGISVPQFFNEYWNPTRSGLVHTNAGWVSKESIEFLL